MQNEAKGARQIVLGCPRWILSMELMRKKSPGTLQPICAELVSEQREEGNSGVVVGIGAGKDHTQFLPLLQEPWACSGISFSWNHGIWAGRILPTRITECWLCPGHPNNPSKSAQRLLLKLFQRPPSVKVTSCSKHLPITWYLQCLTSRHMWIQPILLEFCLWRRPAFAPFWWWKEFQYTDNGKSLHRATSGTSQSSCFGKKNWLFWEKLAVLEWGIHGSAPQHYLAWSSEWGRLKLSSRVLCPKSKALAERNIFSWKKSFLPKELT